MCKVKQFISLISFLLVAPLAYSQAQPQNNTDEVVKTCTELVVVDAHVLKRTGEIVRGLSKEDFTLFEDGAKQQVTHFSQDRLPLSIVVLLDFSASTNWEQIQDRGSRALGRLRREDEVALMVFDTEAFVAQNFTKDRALILEKVKHSKTSDYQRTVRPDGTHIADSIYQAAEQLNKAANPAGRRVIIVVTDNDPFETRIRHSKKAVRNELFETGAVVYGLITDPFSKAPSDPFKYFPPAWLAGKVAFKLRPVGNIGGKVNTYADLTGGVVLDTRKGHLETNLTELVDLLRGRYSFGYRPANSTIDGRVRQIKLKVSPEAEKREGKLMVVSRKGYIRSGCPKIKS